MRNLKKIAALLVVITMVLALVSVPAFAATNATLRMEIEGGKTSMKVGSTVTMNIYLEDGNETFTANMTNYEIAYDPTVFEITNVPITSTSSVTSVNTTDNKIVMCALTPVTATKNSPVQTVTIKALKEVSDVAFAFAAVAVYDSTTTACAVDSTSTVTLSATPVWTATSASTTATVDAVTVGEKELADITAGLASATATVTDGGDNTASGFAIKDWTVTKKDGDAVAADFEFDKWATGTYTLTGTVVADPESAATWTSDLTVDVTVTVNALTEAVAVQPSDIKVKKNSDGTVANLKAIILEAIESKLSLQKTADGDVLDTIAVTAEDITVEELDTTVSGNKVTATISVNGASDKGIFNLAVDKAVTTTLTVTVKSSSSGTVAGIGNPVGGTINTPSTDTDKDTDTDVDTDKDTDVDTDKDTDKDTDVTPVETEFADVPADYWAAECINNLKDLGIVNGKTATTFEPESNVTRAEFAKIIALAFGLEATTTESAFTDCTADAWYTPYVIAATEAGYIKGMAEDFYGADENITRQDIATILGRIIGAEAATELTFTDAADIADYAVDGVAAMVALSVINGYEDGSFRPANNATRAEVAKIICGLVESLTAEEAPAVDADADVTVNEDVDANADADADVVEAEIVDGEVVEEEVAE